MKIMKKITAILLITALCLIMLNFMTVEVFADNFNLNAFEEEPAAAGGVKNLVNDAAVTAISVMRVVCVTIAIVILLTISMKYMMSAPGDRADIKKHAVHYIIGAFILFAVTGILGIINDFAAQI